jgi:hypothetical protein
MTMRDRYLSAQTYPEFLSALTANRDMWEMISRRAAPADVLERVERLAGQWHLLALVEDWCGDAVNTVPPIAALAASANNLDLRVLSRDANPDLMDAHLTGESRSIPIVLVLDGGFREVGCWGPRPSELQRWVRSDGLRLEKSDRYREVRRWYARDRARSTLVELVGIIEAATLERAA